MHMSYGDKETFRLHAKVAFGYTAKAQSSHSNLWLHLISEDGSEIYQSV